MRAVERADCWCADVQSEASFLGDPCKPAVGAQQSASFPSRLTAVVIIEVIIKSFVKIVIEVLIELSCYTWFGPAVGLPTPRAHNFGFIAGIKPAVTKTAFVHIDISFH